MNNLHAEFDISQGATMELRKTRLNFPDVMGINVWGYGLATLRSYGFCNDVR